MESCTLEGCGRPHQARGYCHGHYMRIVMLGHDDTSPLREVERLTDEEVRGLREAAAVGDCSYAELAAVLGIPRTSATALIRGDKRRSAGGPIQPPIRYPELTAEDARTIRELYASGDYSYRDLALEWEVGADRIGRIIRGQALPDAGGPSFSREEIQEISTARRLERRAWA